MGQATASGPTTAASRGSSSRRGAAEAFAQGSRDQLQASIRPGSGSGSAGPASGFAGWARPSGRVLASTTPAPIASGFAGRPAGIDLDDKASASMEKVATVSSTVTDSFSELAKAAA